MFKKSHAQCSLSMRQFFSFATTTTRQRNRASVTRKNPKNVQTSVSKWNSRNEYTVDTMQKSPRIWPENLTTLSRAQLYNFCWVLFLYLLLERLFDCEEGRDLYHKPASFQRHGRSSRVPATRPT